MATSRLPPLPKRLHRLFRRGEKELLKILWESNGAMGPSKSTRSQMKAATGLIKTYRKDRVSGRVSVKLPTGTSVEVEIKDGNESIHARGRAENSSADSIVPSHNAEKAILNGARKVSIFLEENSKNPSSLGLKRKASHFLARGHHLVEFSNYLRGHLPSSMYVFNKWMQILPWKIFRLHKLLLVTRALIKSTTWRTPWPSRRHRIYVESVGGRKL